VDTQIDLAKTDHDESLWRYRAGRKKEFDFFQALEGRTSLVRAIGEAWAKVKCLTKTAAALNNVDTVKKWSSFGQRASGPETRVAIPYYIDDVRRKSSRKL
jgi:hypothetical protein